MEPPFLSLSVGVRGHALTLILPQTQCLSTFTIFVNGLASTGWLAKNLWLVLDSSPFPPPTPLKSIHQVPLLSKLYRRKFPPFLPPRLQPRSGPPSPLPGRLQDSVNCLPFSAPILLVFLWAAGTVAGGVLSLPYRKHSIACLYT